MRCISSCFCPVGSEWPYSIFPLLGTGVAISLCTLATVWPVRQQHKEECYKDVRFKAEAFWFEEVLR